MNGASYLASLRRGAMIGRHAEFAREERREARGFVQVAKPVSKQSAKGQSSKTRTLKVRHWQINAAHFN